MAPNKPIIIAQTATTAQYPRDGVYDTALKNTWLVDSYNYLAEEPGVLAVLYFNYTTAESGECDFEVYTGSTRYDGYKTGVGNPKFLYYAPATLSQLDLMGNP